MTTFRKAAHSLAHTFGPWRDSSTAQVSAVTCVVDQVSAQGVYSGRSEVVTLRLRDGALAVVCTCDQEGCEHVRSAFALLHPDEPMESVDQIQIERRSTEWVDLPMRVSEMPAPLVKGGHDGREQLAVALSEVLLAVARSGVSGGISAGVMEALERVGAHASSPSATGLRVFVGSMRAALDARDQDACVRALAAATSMLDALRTSPPTEASEARVAMWLGPSGSSGFSNTRVSERSYLELSREQRPGLTRADVERRYLLDLSDGAVYREDRAPNEPNASVGPCPRVVTIGLAHIEPGLMPRRIRLLQYTTTPMLQIQSVPASSILEQAASFALPSFEPLLQRYKEHARSSGGLSDLVALVRPVSVTDHELARLTDDAGHSLPLRGAEGAARKLETFLRETTPLWVFGRVSQQANDLALVPLAACGLKDGRPKHLQL